jgi:hypothetical protein
MKMRFMKRNFLSRCETLRNLSYTGRKYCCEGIKVAGIPSLTSVEN